MHGHGEISFGVVIEFIEVIKEFLDVFFEVGIVGGKRVSLISGSLFLISDDFGKDEELISAFVGLVGVFDFFLGLFEVGAVF